MKLKEDIPYSFRKDIWCKLTSSLELWMKKEPKVGTKKEFKHCGENGQMDKALKESGEVNQGKMQINFKKFFFTQKGKVNP